MAKIREIFTSIQGEGPYVGTKQLFIRFCGCNLHCKYCDTDFETAKSKDYTPTGLIQELNTFKDVLTVSLTGGEPLVSAEFLKEFLPLLKQNGHNVYLETNGTLPDELLKVIDYVDIVSADIKLESSTGMKSDVDKYKRFFIIGSEKEIFAKIVFNETITDSEIFECSQIAKCADCEIILQPEMNGNNFAVDTSTQECVFEKFFALYKKVRIIPQVHKFMNIR